MTSPVPPARPPAALTATAVPPRHPRRGTIRRRVLAIALVPGIALLAVGAGVAGVNAYDAARIQRTANLSRDAVPPIVDFLTAAQTERQLTARYLADAGSPKTDLDLSRRDLDAAAERMFEALGDVADDAPADVARTIGQYRDHIAKLPALRQGVDARAVSVEDAMQFWSITTYVVGLSQPLLARRTPTGEEAYQQQLAYTIFLAGDMMTRSGALLVAAASPRGITDGEFQDMLEQASIFRVFLETNVASLRPADQAAFAALTRTAAWRDVLVAEQTLRGTRPRSDRDLHRLPPAAGLSADRVQASSLEVADGLNALWTSQWTYATDLSARKGRDQFTAALVLGAALLAIALGATVVAIRLSARLIRRLSRLREDTLELADTRLPAMVGRLRAGESVDPRTALPPLDHGTDEIGQVADAFSTAQQVAAVAATAEADTRAGMEKVFLNIAHRSQVLAHHQLTLLDGAERAQEDPDQLRVLFELDHLATRARRNAENLLILGGARPGRQWRNPVPLQQITRSAIGESETYARVATEGMPDVALRGTAVADLTHLIAELVDNATRFSPPSSRVDVRGLVVGRGVVVEIEDRGLGIEPEQLARLNAMLTDPPEFGVMALSTEVQLGLFVVARLAARHGILVTLTESRAYGGITAIVRIPNEIVAVPGEPAGPAAVDAPPEQPVLTAPVQQAIEPARPVPPQPAPEPPPPPLPVRQPQPAAANGHPRRRDRRDTTPTGIRIPTTVAPAGARPSLPRRVRQASLVPQLAGPAPAATATATATPPRGTDGSAVAEQARSRLGSLQRGTREARDRTTGEVALPRTPDPTTRGDR